MMPKTIHHDQSDSSTSSIPSKRSGFRLEHLFWFSGLCLLFFTNYKFERVYRPAYIFFNAATLGTMLFCRNLRKIVISRYTLLLWIVAGILSVYYLYGYGNEHLVYLRLYLFGRYCLLFVVGFSVSQDRRFRRFFVWGVLISYVIVGVQDLYILRSFLSVGVSRKVLGETLANSMALTRADGGRHLISVLIDHFPQLSLFVIFSCCLYDDRASGPRKYTLLLFQGTLVGVVVFSTWTAAVFILLIGALLMSFFLLRKKISLTRKILFYSLISSVLFSGYYILNQFTTHSSAKVYERIVAIIAGLASFNWSSFINVLNEASGSRIDLLQISFGSFLGSPLIGVGYFWDYKIVGGHSTIFDTLAQYGLLGGIPILGILFVWLKGTIYNYRHGSKNWTHLSVLVYMLCYSMACILNPYFLQVPEMDYFLFFAAGLICGDNAQIRTVRKSKFNSTKNHSFSRV